MRQRRAVLIGLAILTGCETGQEAKRAADPTADATETSTAFMQPAGALHTLDTPLSTDIREIACDGIDQDSDGTDLCPPDADGDSVRAHLDCNDQDSTVSPDATDFHCDGVDQNCDGSDDCDFDRDGWLAQHDCDDSDPTIRFDCHGPLPLWPVVE